MGPDAFGGDLSDAVAFMHAAPASGVVLEVDDKQHRTVLEDVAVSVQVSDIFVVGEDPGFVLGDAQERDVTHGGCSHSR